MKLKKLICLIFALVLLFSAVACKKPAVQEETGDFRVSVDMLIENMSLDEDSAIGVLETLTSLGLDERIDHIYTAEDDDGNTIYKVWFGLNLLSVSLDGGKVDKVYKYGEQIYPKPTEPETDNNNNGNGNNNTDNGNNGNGNGNGNDNDNNSGNVNTPEPPKELKIEVVTLTSPIKAGKSATVEIIGEPETEYSITVKYSSGPSSAKGLEPKCSDIEGRVSWTWKVSANVKPGEYTITIASGDASYKTTFIVE